MKTFLLLLAAVVAARSAHLGYNSEEPSVYGYLTKYGLPAAERIKEAEDRMMKSKDAWRIVGGSLANHAQFPYQAGLLINFIGSAGRAICGASLIRADRLVTAAHCWTDGVSQAWRLTVTMGSPWLYYGGTRMMTSDVVVHADWEPTTISNDVAMIRLPVAMPLSASIQPIALPSGAELELDFVGEPSVASGYGLTNSGSITHQQGLSFVHLNVIRNSVCNVAFLGFVRTSNICTSGVGGTSTCQGDSGGPLVVESNGRDILVGITSFGSGLGCSIGMPAVFARVTSFMDFINAYL